MHPKKLVQEIETFVDRCNSGAQINGLSPEDFARFGLIQSHIQSTNIRMQIEAGSMSGLNPENNIFFPVMEDREQAEARVNRPTSRATNAGLTIVNNDYDENKADADKQIAGRLVDDLNKVFKGDQRNIGFGSRFGFPLGEEGISVRVTNSGTGGSFGGMAISIIQVLLARTDAHPDAYKIHRNNQWGLGIPNGIIVRAVDNKNNPRPYADMLATAVEEVLHLRLAPIMIGTYGNLISFYIEEALFFEILCKIGLRHPEDAGTTPANIPNFETVNEELKKLIRTLNFSDVLSHPNTKNNFFFETTQITESFREEHPDFVPVIKEFIDKLKASRKRRSKSL